MSIVRVKHQKNYVVLNKFALEDRRLSFKAKGLWAYCMSLPDDWDFHVNHLATVSQDGVDAVYSAIKELIEFGYCEKVQPNKGKFEKLEYFIYETPEFKKSLPQTDFPDAGASLAENPPLLSTKERLSTKEEVVCYQEPVAPEIQRSSKENIIKESLEIPSKLIKTHPDGHEIQVHLQDIFYHSVRSKKDWDTTEIHEAWKILKEYAGAVREGIPFISGTIKNLRNKKKSGYLAEGKKCQQKEMPKSSQCKENSSVKDTVEHPSLQFLLEQAGMA